MGLDPQLANERIYIASKTSHRQRWRDLRQQGIPFISRWLEEDVDTFRPAEHWLSFLEDLHRSSSFIYYFDSHDSPHKGAIFEAGVALSLAYTTTDARHVLEQNGPYGQSKRMKAGLEISPGAEVVTYPFYLVSMYSREELASKIGTWVHLPCVRHYFTIHQALDHLRSLHEEAIF